MNRASFAVLVVVLLAATAFADPPSVKVLGPALSPPPESAPLVVSAGRFVPLTPKSGEPVYLPTNRGYRVYKLAPGSVYVGIKWDAAPDAEPEPWTVPADVKGPVYVLLARGYAGTYTIQPLKNGPADVGPVEDGGPLTVQIVVGPRPPPVDPVNPILTPFQTKLQFAYRADGATPESKAKYAALWRNAAKTTVYDSGLTTPAAVLAELQAAVKLLGVPAGSLNATARAVADEINPLMPTPANGLLSPATRDGMAAVFTRIAQDLEVIK